MESDGEELINTIAVNWTDHALTWKLLKAIKADDVINKTLFPSAEYKARFGKQLKPKTVYHNALASTLFADHPDYKAEFKAASTPSEKSPWGVKIEHRLEQLVKIYRIHTKDMSWAGCEINDEDEIDMSDHEEPLTKKWPIIKKSFPWYWLLKGILNEHPCFSGLGVYNSLTPMDRDREELDRLKKKRKEKQQRAQQRAQQAQEDHEQGGGGSGSSGSSQVVGRKRSSTNSAAAAPAPLQKKPKTSSNSDTLSPTQLLSAQLAEVRSNRTQLQIDMDDLDNKRELAKLNFELEMEEYKFREGKYQREFYSMLEKEAQLQREMNQLTARRR
ncbi:hypothetical protein CPC08DRAFT_702983 [Agrocybe pediades]|nr:hypothetical protein CPC08DRAFT_702983 [Agrocybe pediades]